MTHFSAFFLPSSSKRPTDLFVVENGSGTRGEKALGGRIKAGATASTTTTTTPAALSGGYSASAVHLNRSSSPSHVGEAEANEKSEERTRGLLERKKETERPRKTSTSEGKHVLGEDFRHMASDLEEEKEETRSPRLLGRNALVGSFAPLLGSSSSLLSTTRRQQQPQQKPLLGCASLRQAVSSSSYADDKENDSAGEAPHPSSGRDSENHLSSRSSSTPPPQSVSRPASSHRKRSARNTSGGYEVSRANNEKEGSGALPLGEARRKGQHLSWKGEPEISLGSPGVRERSLQQDNDNTPVIASTTFFSSADKKMPSPTASANMSTGVSQTPSDRVSSIASSGAILSSSASLGEPTGKGGGGPKTPGGSCCETASSSSSSSLSFFPGPSCSRSSSSLPAGPTTLAPSWLLSALFSPAGESSSAFSSSSLKGGGGRNCCRGRRSFTIG